MAMAAEAGAAAVPSSLQADAFKRLYPEQYLERFLAEGLRPDGRTPAACRPATIGMHSAAQVRRLCAITLSRCICHCCCVAIAAAAAAATAVPLPLLLPVLLLPLLLHGRPHATIRMHSLPPACAAFSHACGTHGSTSPQVASKPPMRPHSLMPREQWGQPYGAATLLLHPMPLCHAGGWLRAGQAGAHHRHGRRAFRGDGAPRSPPRYRSTGGQCGNDAAGDGRLAAGAAQRGGGHYCCHARKHSHRWGARLDVQGWGCHIVGLGARVYQA